MYRKSCYIILLTILFVVSNSEQQIEGKKDRVMGMEAVHNVKIDKDTIITTNLKLDTRKKDKNPEPDWSYRAIPDEMSSHVLDFKRNMTECLKEVQSKDKRPVKRLSPKQESPIHGECLIACVLKRNGVIINGKINKVNLLTLVSKFHAKETKLMKKLEKNLDRCINISIKNRDECKLASQLNDCTNDLMANSKDNILFNY